jgi:hypothetical protein
VYRVEKSKDCNRSGETISISDLKQLRLFITSTTPIVIENPTTITRNICFFEFRHPKVIDRRKHSFEERTQPLRNISQRSRARCTDKSRFNWVFMKLPNHTKKRETRATLNTFKIMSLVKREMKFQNIRLGKIGDHICTNKRIKLRENRRNIKLFTNKHKVVTTFIHVSNDKGPLENL